MILVAGATGLLGSEICSRLRAQGRAVRAMARTGSKPDKVAALLSMAAALEGSGMEYTVLLANFFMEVWLSPALGFDYANRRATIYGDGKQPIAWVSYRDVAGFAADAHGNPAVRNRALLVAGPQALSPLEVVRLFEQVTESPFAVEHVPHAALEKQYAEAMDPMGRTFAALMLGYADGCPMEMNETLSLLPRRLTTVQDYAAAAGRNT